MIIIFDTITDSLLWKNDNLCDPVKLQSQFSTVPMKLIFAPSPYQTSDSFKMKLKVPTVYLPTES